jgi:S-formylglutathione hydrolase
MQIRATHRVFGGEVSYVVHDSAATGSPMRFSVFMPPGEGPHPYVVWLSGLTCTEDNFTTKAGAYGTAADLGLAIVAPDTSPRGEGVADDPAYDLGQGAGFYVDATQPPWAPHFSLYSYVTRDLIDTVEAGFRLDGSRRGVLGHSMGGHGALTIALRNPDLFRSVSALAPIVAPSQCPWGEKALTAYLGADRAAWRAHDAVALIEDGAARGRFDEILIDQGRDDPFVDSQLKPELFRAACAGAGQPLRLRLQGGYDHSYFFISSFIAQHLAFHAERLR